MEKEKNTRGRPLEYTKTQAEIICLRLSEGESLRAICSDEDMPAKGTVLRWLASIQEFRDQYARAKELAVDAIAEEIFDIADDGANDWMEKFDKNGEAIGWQLNGEHVKRSHLRVETRKWYLSRIAPKKYGDKQAVDHTSTDGTMTPRSDITDEQLKQKLRELGYGRKSEQLSDKRTNIRSSEKAKTRRGEKKAN